MVSEHNIPFVSIIIPTYARPQRLADCLASVAQLDYVADGFEVIVVDDGGAMDLEDVVEAFRPKLNITLIKQQNSGPAAARNRGAAQARGELLAFIDDDCRVDPNWLTVVVELLKKYPNILIRGRTVNGVLGNDYAVVSQLLVDYLYENFSGHRFVTSNNMGVSAEKYNQLNGFDTTFRLAAGEDRDFCRRWLQAGFDIHIADEALVNHHNQMTLRSFCQQHYNYGWGAHQFRQRSTQKGEGAIPFESLTFYIKLIFYPLTVRDQTIALGRRLRLVGLMVLSQFANAVGLLSGRMLA